MTNEKLEEVLDEIEEDIEQKSFNGIDCGNYDYVSMKDVYEILEKYRKQIISKE